MSLSLPDAVMAYKEASQALEGIKMAIRYGATGLDAALEAADERVARAAAILPGLAEKCSFDELDKAPNLWGYTGSAIQQVAEIVAQRRREYVKATNAIRSFEQAVRLLRENTCTYIFNAIGQIKCLTGAQYRYAHDEIWKIVDAQEYDDEKNGRESELQPLIIALGRCVDKATAEQHMLYGVMDEEEWTAFVEDATKGNA